MNDRWTRWLAALLLICGVPVTAAPAARSAVECLVASKPGGTMDLTCKLARKGLQELCVDTRIGCLPGDIGAVAWHTLASQRRAEPNTLVVFSGDSLLNLAHGKFGDARASDVRWVAAPDVDYGMIAVHSDSPYQNLADLVAALRQYPEKILIGASGTKWVATFKHMLAEPEFAHTRAMYGLYPFSLTGAAPTGYIGKAVTAYRQRAAEFGLLR